MQLFFWYLMMLSVLWLHSTNDRINEHGAFGAMRTGRGNQSTCGKPPSNSKALCNHAPHPFIWACWWQAKLSSVYHVKLVCTKLEERLLSSVLRSRSFQTCNLLFIYSTQWELILARWSIFCRVWRVHGLSKWADMFVEILPHLRGGKCSNKITGWTTGKSGFYSWWRQRFLSFPVCPDSLWDPPGLLFNG
jgi:hypothetical protein